MSAGEQLADNVKAHANRYARYKSVGQLFLTGANIASLVPLYLRANKADSSSFQFREAVKGLIITTFALSGFVLILQFTLVVSTAKTEAPIKLQPLFPKDQAGKEQVFPAWQRVLNMITTLLTVIILFLIAVISGLSVQTDSLSAAPSGA
eukprot:jgi/Chlat1/6003/Chrsp4S06194